MAIVLDFESHGIESRPVFPPKPVGLAYGIGNREPKYLAWGHPTRNNATPNQAMEILDNAWKGRYGEVIFHNSSFDIDIAQTHFGMKGMPVSYGDTLFLGFLDDPRAQSLRLKDMAKRYLKRDAPERDELYEWITDNVRINNRKVPKSKLGAYIAEAPGDLVGSYAADGDVSMTFELYEKLARKVKTRGMWGAYERELALVPITMEMERTGLRVSRRRLVVLAEALEVLRDRWDARIRKILKVGKTFNVGSGPQLGEALIKGKFLRESTFTPTGKQSTSKGVLVDTCNDDKLTLLLRLRSVADQYLGGFVLPWIEKSAHTGGFVLPRFNQVRGSDIGGGARTGRYSSSDPNFQNIPANIDESKDAALLKLLGRELAKLGIRNFRGLRDYFYPDEGKMWAAVDYSQQELRITAHYEAGELLSEYLRNPGLDVHSWVQQLIKDKSGREWPRKHIKSVVFMLLYGGGAKKLAVMLNIPVEDAYELRNDVLGALPGVKRLMKETRDEITTWGKRIYPVEDAKIVGGSPDDPGTPWDLSYKQLNCKIQGSAADCTKQGMLNVHKALPHCRIALQVHDELGVQVHNKEEAQEVARAMADVEFSLPMTATAKISKTTWARAA